MKVLHLIKTTLGATWALREIRILLRLGCEVHVLLPNEEGLCEQYREAGANVYVANVDIASFLASPRRFYRAATQFRNLISEIKPDIIHSHFVGTTIFMRLALVGVPVKRIFQVPGPLHLENYFTRKVEVFLSNKFDYWIPTCYLSKKYYLQEGVVEDRMMVSFYGSDVSIFNANQSKGNLREELNLSSNTIIIGMVAFLYPPKKWIGQKRGLKGHEDLIDAVEIVLKHRNDVACIIIGGAWDGAKEYYDKVVIYGKEKLRNNIFFLGTRTDVPSLYPDFNIAVHPSLSENLGGAAESLLMGIPTIATNIGGFPDIVKENETGWLVPASDPENLAIKILSVLDDMDNAIQVANFGRKKMLRELDVNHTAAQVFDFYKHVMSVENA